ncbi:hypothetical protein RclHR1_00030045 [Rhizophagus clarus]|uniref:Uncharacterized protein n=1 Tax=Rhizophagus clarus TaxID=94130 RepID=A0A2Z6S068_9GLOM|nr:hypothetical protein RclHR1_00030045 [Rhizophagus clarus]GES95552.1 hypothetical protein GLOIN_2v1769481 [Rhizophagus clarus]
MASFLLSECLEKIFLNLLEYPSVNIRIYTSTKDLYSCTLVSRYWCRISTPFLYEYPFHHFRHLSYPNITYFKLIRTLLSCIPKTEIEQIVFSNYSIIQKLCYKPKPLDITTTFNYTTFIRGLIFSENLSEPLLFFYRKIWLPPYIPDSSNMKNDQFSKISIPIMNYLVDFLCRHCNNLRTLEFPFRVQNNEHFNKIIELLTNKDCNGISKLNDLKELFYINRSNEITLSTKDFYSTLSCNISKLDLLYNEGINSPEKATSLSQFISLQKNLHHLILAEYRYGSMLYNIDHYNVIFNSLTTQIESLRALEFKYLSFSGIDETALNSLCSLKNIEELKLYNCRKIDDNLNAWAKCLSRIEVFEFIANYYSSISEDFLDQIIKSSSTTLTRLVIKFQRGDNEQTIFQQIPLYLNSLTYLVLPKIYPHELISIFKSCIKLVYISASLCDISWEENFECLGQLIPKDLQRIDFNDVDREMFTSNALRLLFKGCKINGGKLKCLRVKGKFILSQDYFDIANEFNIKLINKRKLY